MSRFVLPSNYSQATRDSIPHIPQVNIHTDTLNESGFVESVSVLGLVWSSGLIVSQVRLLRLVGGPFTRITPRVQVGDSDCYRWKIV